MKSRSPSKVSASGVADDKLRIIIRIRPILSEENSAQFVELGDVTSNLSQESTLVIKRPGNPICMKFSSILPAEASQKDVFNLLHESVRQFLEGINTTIFAYGQTGAGKTYSMIGDFNPCDNQESAYDFMVGKERGVLSRSLEHIMSWAQQQVDAIITVSFFQIYNEKIFDLYRNNQAPLEIREAKNGEISIPDLVCARVTNIGEATQFLAIGLKNRMTGSTHANSKSSRSHSIFQINLEKPDSNGHPVYSSLRIVDLAGSEKFKIPSDISVAEKETRIQQLTSINGSLSALGQCISALIERSRTHIPFRNSKLTRILSDSLLGFGKMRFIICISPSTSASTETFSTLQFANRAKKAILERAQIRTPHLSKKKDDNSDLNLLKKQLEKEREVRLELERELAHFRNENISLKREMQKFTGSHSRPASSQLSCSPQYPDNKENDFKQQILNLSVFQKRTRPSPIKEAPVTQKSQANRKKAEFEKKIRKFIETDSPSQNEQRKYDRLQSLPDEVSFERKFGPSRVQIEPYCQRSCFEKVDPFEVSEGNANSNQFWPNECEDPNQFIKHACNRMNVLELSNLQKEMEKAKDKLMDLRRRDNNLEQRKSQLR